MDRDKQILERIKEEINFVSETLEGIDRDTFLANKTLQHAIAMATLNIGEWAKHLSDQTLLSEKGSAFRPAIRTRDLYAHGYAILDFEQVYETAICDLPELKEAASRIINS